MNGNRETRRTGATASPTGSVLEATVAETGAGAVARNYLPLPVTIVDGRGSWVRDDEGRRYLDLLAGYSALNFGHRHPRLVAAAHRQLERLTLTSRAFGNDQLEPLCNELAALAGMEAVLLMNTGAEAVESAIKVARRWGYRERGVSVGDARIVTFADGFHGRTTTIVGFSTDPSARADFGPFTPGFDTVPYGDLDAVEQVVSDDTVAVLVEPVQGEAGVVAPPDGFLRGLRSFCDATGILMIADEIQSGLGRTGTTFACDHEDVRPDLYLLGKALGGGIVPISAVVGDWRVLGVLDPGSHGSTFGGNPLACAVAREVVAMLGTGEPQAAARMLGDHLESLLHSVPAREVRVRGPWAGIDVHRRSGREVCEALLERGVLAKETHGRTLRIAPPLTTAPDDLTWGIEQLARVLSHG